MIILFTCIEVNTEKNRNLFLSLPKKLYDKRFLTQDIEVEKQILNGIDIPKEIFDINNI